MSFRHLHFTQSLEPLYGGGLGTTTVALHRQLLSMGIESVLCSTYGEAPQKAANGVLEFRRVKPGFLYYSPELKARARKLVGGADILHGHGLYVGTNYLLGSEARNQRKPLVYHAHGFFEPWILKRSRWKKCLVHWLFENANFRHASLWRALTNKEADQVRQQGIKAPIVVAPNGVRLEEFDSSVPAKRSASELNRAAANGKRRILFMARLHPKKGLDLLLSAWSRLKSRWRTWELVIAGPDEGGYRASVERMIKEFGIQTATVLTGSVTGTAKVNLLHSAAFFVLPSYSEGFSMAILEAMACRKPVIASYACNFEELEREGGGWLCEATEESVQQILGQATECSESELEARGSCARALVERRYTWPTVAATIQAACEQCCK